MKKTTYNMNCQLSFENVCSQLTKFWQGEIIKSNFSKVWVSIIVTNNRNKSRLLINNLPFNTLNYTDIIIVLKQVFEDKKFSNRKDILKRIDFNFKLEDEYNRSSYNLYWYILIYIIFIIIMSVIFVDLIIYLDVSSIKFNIKDETLNITDYTHKLPINRTEYVYNVYTNKCIFEPFIRIFSNKSYFPSYFLPGELRVDIKDFNLLEYIIYNQYVILDYQTTCLMDYISGLNAILEQYRTISDRISI